MTNLFLKYANDRTQSNMTMQLVEICFLINYLFFFISPTKKDTHTLLKIYLQFTFLTSIFYFLRENIIK